MAILIGVDEAGYGPNLGPLVVAATRWETDDDVIDAGEIQTRLEPAVHRGPVRDDPERIAIADSKMLYSPGGGLAELERSVHAALRFTGNEVSTWRELWPAVAPDSFAELDKAPWRRDYDEPLPIDADPAHIEQACEVLTWQLDAANMKLASIRAAVVFPAEFNRLIEIHGNKATGLSTTSLTLARSLLDDGRDLTLVHCDKHGGRKRYGALLQQIFPEHFVLTRKESPEESAYVAGAGRNTTFRFVAKGDHFLPAALASMFAKYLRELSMRAFNRYWIHHAPGTKPTAGYPVDAKRFKKDIAEAQKRLKIADEDLWRAK